MQKVYIISIKLLTFLLKIVSGFFSQEGQDPEIKIIGIDPGTLFFTIHIKFLIKMWLN